MTERGARLGILGGMGPQATVTLYQRVVALTSARRDQEHLPTLIWSDALIPDRTAAILSGAVEPVLDRLLAGVKLLEREGCTAVAIPCNTAHFFADRLQEELGIPLLHMVRLAVAAAKARGLRRVGILSTDGTIRSELYQRECLAHGMESVIPKPEVQRQIMSIIYEEIKQGGPGSPERFAMADRDLRAQGCDGGLLACTELSVFRLNFGLPEFYIDALEVLAEECVRSCGYPLRENAPPSIGRPLKTTNPQMGKYSK